MNNAVYFSFMSIILNSELEVSGIQADLVMKKLPVTTHYSDLFKLSSPNLSKFRSSHRRYSMKIGVPKNFANFTGKHLCRSLFLIRLQALKPTTLLKGDSNAGVFL